MDDKRTYDYMRFEMTSGVGGDPTNGFYVAMQWIRETTQANRINVPVDGIAAGRFRSLENAFDASFDSMRTAIDRQVSAGRTSCSCGTSSIVRRLTVGQRMH